MDFTFSKHAIEQMQERSISKESVEKILEYPLEIVYEEEHSIFHGLTFENNKHYLIRIFVNLLVEPNNIITVYKTSKIRKYYEGEIR
ncbi:MAG: DUF4258 domain-containing protein [Chitinophagaceae bacterium]|nr:DUF4258 domain-containing protein [Chitinophagaceae bacterium]